METEAKIKEVKKQMVSIEEHNELKKRIKQPEKDRDEFRSALEAQKEDIDSNQTSIKNIEKDTKKNKEDINSSRYLRKLNSYINIYIKKNKNISKLNGKLLRKWVLLKNP